MKNIKENFDLFTVIFAIILCILLFFSLFIQIPVFINAINYERSLSSIEQLTEKEVEDICFGDPCNYTHKIFFDSHSIKVSNPGIHFTNEVWVYFKTIRSKKIYMDRSDFLFLYVIFDLASIAFLLSTFFYMKHEKAKEIPTKDSKKLNRLFQGKANRAEANGKQEPLPPFGFVFMLGYLQFAACFFGSYMITKSFPSVEWIFLFSFFLPFLTGILLYYTTKKSMAFLLSSILCLAPAATGRDIVYIDNLLNPTPHPMQENVYTLEKGTLNRKYTGANTTVMSSGSKNRSRSYYYHFVAPYQTETDSFTNWLVLKREWLEDETKFVLFWEEWKEKRLAVQIYDEETLYAITKAGNRYHLDLSGGVALLKPILSLEEEIETTVWNVLWTVGMALLIWTFVGGLRIYASKE